MNGLTLRRALAPCALALSLVASVANAAPPSLRPAGTPVDGPYFVLAGSMHDHSFDSDGHARGEDILSWEAAHRYELGIDFASLTDHSDFFPIGGNSLATEQSLATTPDFVWPHQATLLGQYAGQNGFTMLRGFEYTSDQENHLNVIGSQNWAQPVANHAGDLTMAFFYNWLKSHPTPDPAGLGAGYGGNDGIGQFNHPDSKGALNFDDYAYDASVAPYMSTIEMFGDQGYPGGLHRSDGGWYWFALSQGWTVGPVMDWDNHYWNDKIAAVNPGSRCGSGAYLPCERSLVFAAQNTRPAIMDALRARRTGATQFPGLWAAVRSGNTWMGSTIAVRPGKRFFVTVDAGSDVNPLQSVEIVSDNGVSPFPYFYGDNLACNATPIAYGGNLNPNCLPEEIGHSSLAISYALQHEKYVRTNGHATRKDIIDAPPTGTTVARLGLRGARETVCVPVAMPTVASTRPDGKHFFYAVVTAADGSRAWTAPLLVTPASGGTGGGDRGDDARAGSADGCSATSGLPKGNGDDARTRTIRVIR